MRKSLQERLDELASDSLRKHDGNIDLARKSMKAALLCNQVLLSDLLDEVVYSATDNSIRNRHRDNNAQAFNSVIRESIKSTKAAQTAMIQSAVRTLLMDVVLGNGSRLRSAVRPELRREADFHYKQSRTMSIKAAFFAAIAQKLPNDKTPVEKVLTEDDLRNLFNEARGAAA